MKSVAFFSDEIVIRPHTATLDRHVGALISIRLFAGEERVSLYQLPGGDYLVQTPTGRFIEGPEVTDAKAEEPATGRDVCSFGNHKLSVLVSPSGWQVLYGCKPASLGDIPKQYHSLIKAVVKDVAYDLGYYTMKVPPVTSSRWDKVDWINYVKFNFDI